MIVLTLMPVTEPGVILIMNDRVIGMIRRKENGANRMKIGLAFDKSIRILRWSLATEEQRAEAEKF